MQHAVWKFWHMRRYVVSILAFFGFLMIYMLRVNLSVAIVKMTENRTIADEYGNVTYTPEFNWDSRIQGYVLSSFFYGYITTPLVGGWLAARIGGKRVFGLGIAVTALLTCVTPPATRLSVYLLLVIRVVEGLFEGVTYPAINAVMANWAPPLERSRLTTLAYAGSFVGTVLAMPLCSIMAERLGWSSLFYVFGVVGLAWYACWCYVVSDRPEDDRRISENELKYIRDSLGAADCEKISHPWKTMLTSPPVWAIIVAHTSENWGFYTMITQLPTFMSDALDFKLEKAGYLSALPYFAMATILLLTGQLADYLRSREFLTTTQVRKIFTCVAFVCQSTFMICVACFLTAEVAVTCITLAIGLGGFAWSGFSVNYLDIAPKHASVLFGIGNTVATLPGIISPILTGYVVRNKTPDEWRIVFFIASGFYVVGAVVYGFLASGEQQPWATTTKVSSDETVPDTRVDE